MGVSWWFDTQIQTTSWRLKSQGKAQVGSRRVCLALGPECHIPRGCTGTTYARGLVWSYVRQWVQDLPSEQLWAMGNLGANKPFNSSGDGCHDGVP